MSELMHQYRDCRLLGWQPSDGRENLDQRFQEALRPHLDRVKELRQAYERQRRGKCFRRSA